MDSMIAGVNYAPPLSDDSFIHELNADVPASLETLGEDELELSAAIGKILYVSFLFQIHLFPHCARA